MSLKPWQVWGFDHLSREPVAGFDHSLCKKKLPNVQTEQTVKHSFEILNHSVPRDLLNTA